MSDSEYMRLRRLRLDELLREPKDTIKAFVFSLPYTTKLLVQFLLEGE